MIRLSLIFLVALAPLSAAHAGDDVKITPDVIYGRKDGMCLTMDVLKPAKPNGAAVLFLQSGGWYSIWREPKNAIPASKPLLDKGFTVFLVYHGSAPRYAIPDATDDVRRAVRFVRLRANDFGVDPKRLGVFGGSAGGHLTLLLATTADGGDKNAKDAVLQQSNRIAAAVALFPPTDVRKLVTDPPEIIRKNARLKPPLTFDPKKAPDYSPVLHVKPDTAPTLLIHGDKDELVPIEHSRNMIAALEKHKVKSELLVIEGAAHGFNAKQNLVVVPAMVGWFEKHLGAK